MSGTLPAFTVEELQNRAREEGIGVEVVFKQLLLQRHEQYVDHEEHWEDAAKTFPEKFCKRLPSEEVPSFAPIYYNLLA